MGMVVEAVVSLSIEDTARLFATGVVFDDDGTARSTGTLNVPDAKGAILEGRHVNLRATDPTHTEVIFSRWRRSEGTLGDVAIGSWLALRMIQHLTARVKEAGGQVQITAYRPQTLYL